MSVEPSLAPPGTMGADKALHLVSFAALAAVAMISFRHWRGQAIALGLIASLGLVTEAAQMFVPGRQGSVMDLAANFAGLIIGTLAIRLLRLWTRKLQTVR